MDGVFDGYRAASLAAELEGGGSVTIAVRDLDSGEVWSVNGDVAHEAGSSFKIMSVAAALDENPDFSEADAQQIFYASDNVLTGKAIFDAGGACAVNTFIRCQGGMHDSALKHWVIGPYSHLCHAGEYTPACGAPLTSAPGDPNYFTGHDVLEFLSRLHDRSLFAPDREARCPGGSCAQRLMGFMQLSPRQGVYGPLGTPLPAGARELLMHKVGAIPDPIWQYNDVGIVQVPEGSAYAIAVLTHAQAASWFGPQQALVERVAGEVYNVMSGQGADNCDAGASIACQSNTLGCNVPLGTCVQSSSDSAWYRCGSDGGWGNAIDPASAGCNGYFPLGRSCGQGAQSSLSGVATSDPCSQASSGDGPYCGASLVGGDASVLYECAGGVTTSTTHCESGCQINAAGSPDACG
jgi:hypothetical protein